MWFTRRLRTILRVSSLKLNRIFEFVFLFLKKYVAKFDVLVFEFYSTFSNDQIRFDVDGSDACWREVCSLLMFSLSIDFNIHLTFSRDNPPLMKLQSRLFGTLEKVEFEFLRLSLPLTCHDQFTPR